MLSLLHIENIALIDQADISLGSGFNQLSLMPLVPYWGSAPAET